MTTATLNPLDSIEPVWNDWIPHEPSEKQHAALLLDWVLEILYGGAAGGGKSDWMLMSALQYVDYPDYSALLLRKTFTELKLPGALMDRALHWGLQQKGAKWNANEYQWTFPSGATINFGYLKTEADRMRYQSAEFQFIGFDELTSFEEIDYTFMFSRLRRIKGTEIPLRMRGATNPGGPGHEWVKKRFLENRRANAKRGRIFIPATLDDNPHIDRDMYMMSLDELDPALRQQLLMGDWDAREPGYWMIQDPKWVDAAVELGGAMAASNMVPEPADGGALQIGIDWGEITQAYTIWPLEMGGFYIPPSETIGRHEEPAQVSQRIIQNALKFGLPVSEARYDSAGVQSMRTFIAQARATEGLERLRTASIPFNKFKYDGINYLRVLLRRTAEGKTTRILAIHPANKELIRQLKRWQRKDEESEQAVKLDDHGPDALIAGIAPTAHRHRLAVEKMKAESYKSDRLNMRTPTDPDEAGLTGTARGAFNGNGRR